MDRRESLISELWHLNDRRYELDSRLRYVPDTSFLRQDSVRYSARLAAVQRSTPLDPEEVSSLERSLQGVLQQMRAAVSLPGEIEGVDAEYQATQQLLNAVDQRIGTLFDTTRSNNQFRAIVTTAYAVMVLSVIVGFYIIVFKTGVASTIFAGDMGMQFVTLFLIVIAIILFGMVNVLEGRELAALLGGISGYILGRAGTRQPDRPAEKGSPQPAPETTPQQ
jgi:CBS domain containing-hemolysin-like protein